MAADLKTLKIKSKSYLNRRKINGKIQDSNLSNHLVWSVGNRISFIAKKKTFIFSLTIRLTLPAH